MPPDYFTAERRACLPLKASLHSRRAAVCAVRSHPVVEVTPLFMSLLADGVGHRTHLAELAAKHDLR